MVFAYGCSGISACPRLGVVPVSRRRFTRAPVLLAVMSAAGALVASARADDEAVLRVTGMTFVGSKGKAAELLLHSERAVFRAESDLAELEVVRAVFKDEENGESFAMSCDRAELNVETNDFVAMGNVRGVTADGQRYASPIVHYEHGPGLLRSDQWVTMVDDTGSFRGDGFLYHVHERRFRLLGNVRVVQTP
jgi:LPS export ABC transporter protein LptC